MTDDLQQFVAEMSNTKTPKEVKSTDVIHVGCDNCGSCCIDTTMKLSAFDIYRIAKKTGMKETADNMTFYFGDISHLPIIGLFASENNHMCPYLKATNSGDYECVLGDDKPSACTHPFIALGIMFNQQEFNFVPLDQQVPKMDIEKFLSDHDIDKTLKYYLTERSCACHASNKKDMTVMEYMQYRKKYDREQNLSTLVSMLINRYIDVYKFTRLLYLADHSSVNEKSMKSLFGELSSYDKITRAMFSDAYLYTDIDSDKSFEEQTIAHIHYLEDKKYPLLRLLYKYLFRVFDPSNVFLNEILETDDVELAQERFDNYFSSNLENIKKHFYTDMMPNMVKEMKEMNI